MKHAAAPVTTAALLALMLSGCSSEKKGGVEGELVLTQGRSVYGEIGTGATRPGTAGGGTRSTNQSAIQSGSYGLRPGWARRNEPVPGGVAAPPTKGPGFATSPEVVVAQVPEAEKAALAGYVSEAGVAPAAFVPIPPGATGSAVRDHSYPAHESSPAPGGYWRPNSVPSMEVGATLPPYHANPAVETDPAPVSPNAHVPGEHRGASGQEGSRDPITH